MCIRDRDKDKSFDVETTNTTIAHKLANVERAVIPGFYGTLPDGMIHFLLNETKR